MQTSLNETARGMRTSIAFFGKRNCGKSSLVNAIVGSEISLVSNVAGTTTDPVYKNMELLPLGAVVLVDTAGFDDVGELGNMRVAKTIKVADSCDIAVIVISKFDSDLVREIELYNKFIESNTSVIVVQSKSDLASENISTNAELSDNSEQLIASKFPREDIISVSSKTRQNIEVLKLKIAQSKAIDEPTLVGHLVQANDNVVLVTPIDVQAPKGRLILPQVQVIRDLLDIGAIIHITQLVGLPKLLDSIKRSPRLIITDSQVFLEVQKLCPEQTLLTSFSVLMARYKGDIELFVAGAKAIESLKEFDNVLVLEACTHNALDGDIAREKIPRLLAKKVKNLNVNVVSGEIPMDVSKYSLIIHCGGCMITRKAVMSRLAKVRNQNVPITNYGIAIAYLTNILDKIVY